MPSTTSPATPHSHPGTSCLRSRCSTCRSGWKARVATARAGTAGTGIAASAGSVDRDRREVASALEADHRLPRAADRDRLRRDVDAAAERAQAVGDESAAALPGGDREPVRVRDRARRVEADRRRDGAARVAGSASRVHGPQRDLGMRVSRRRGRQQERHDGGGCDQARAGRRPGARASDERVVPVAGRRPRTCRARRRRSRPAARARSPRAGCAPARAAASTTWLQPYSASEADRADQHAGQRAEAAAGAGARRDQRERLDEQRLGDVEREVRASSRRRPPRRAARARRACTRKKATAAERAAAADAACAPARARAPAARRSAAGGTASRNCGTPKSNSAWKIDSADQQAAGADQARRGAAATSARLSRPRRPRGARSAQSPSASSTSTGRRASARRRREHQVRRAPQRHVLAEEPVPDVVEREAEQRERRRRRRSAGRRAGAYQSARDLDGGGPGSLLAGARSRASRPRRCRTGRRG